MALPLNPALNIAYIDQAYGEDPVILHMIFDAFLTDSYPRWQSLEQAIGSDDKKEAASIVHGLKPSFTMTGLSGIRSRVEVLEKAIKDEAPSAELMDMYTSISEELAVFIPILREESEKLKNM